MIRSLLTTVALAKIAQTFLGDDSAGRDEEEPNHHPLLIAGGVAVAAGLLTRAIVRKKRFFDLHGKVVILTGGSRGLGLEVARQLVAKGARVAICARDETELREAQDDLHDRGGEVFAGLCDVTKPDQVRHFADLVRGQMGPPDVLINNAGLIVVGPVETMAAADFGRVMDTNFNGPLAFILEVLPDLIARGGGRILNVASIGGRVPLPHLVAYSASKFALVGLGEGLRTELLKHNVYVTTVCPGTVRTGSPLHATFKGDVEAEYEWFATGDNTPGLSISTERMAAKIIDGLEHGDAEVITPWTAKLQSLFQGVAPGVATEVATLIDRLLPDAAGAAGANRTSATGREADVGQLPAYTAEMQAEAAAEFNED